MKLFRTFNIDTIKDCRDVLSVDTFWCIYNQTCCLVYSSVFLYVFTVYLYFYFCAASYGVIKNDIIV